MKRIFLTMSMLALLSGCMTVLPLHKDSSYDETRAKNIQLPSSCTSIKSDYGSLNGVNDLMRAKTHDGIDMVIPIGTEVIAAEKGKVIKAFFIQCGGKMIWIEHPRNKAGNTVITSYLHLSRMDVKEGDHVVQGEVIGLSGVTGSDKCTTNVPHLHFELKAGDTSVAPIEYWPDGWPKNMSRVSPHGFWATSSQGEVAHLDGRTGKIDKATDGLIFPLICGGG